MALPNRCRVRSKRRATPGSSRWTSRQRDEGWEEGRGGKGSWYWQLAWEGRTWMFCSFKACSHSQELTPSQDTGTVPRRDRVPAQRPARGRTQRGRDEETPRQDLLHEE